MVHSLSNKKAIERLSESGMDVDMIGPAAVVAKLCAILGPDGVRMAAKTKGREIFGYPEEYIEAGIENYKILKEINESNEAGVLRSALSDDAEDASKLPSEPVRLAAEQTIEQKKHTSEQPQVDVGGNLPRKVVFQKARIGKRKFEGSPNKSEARGENMLQEGEFGRKRKLTREFSGKTGSRDGEANGKALIFRNLDSYLSDWVDLTTNGALQYNHQTGQVREGGSLVIRGQLPTYEIGSKEFEELAEGEPKPKQAHSKNRPGPRNMTWQLVPGSDRVPAIRGNPDASKFTVIRQCTNRTPQIIDTFLYKHVAGFDWNDGPSVTKLNKWRQQTIRRFEGTLIHERRLPWSELEHQRLVELLRNALQANDNVRTTLDWEAITWDFNNSFKGVEQKKGEPLARPFSSTKRNPDGYLMGEQCAGGVIDHDRVGSSRDATGLRNQAKRFPDTLKMWNDALQSKRTKAKATKETSLVIPNAAEKSVAGETENPPAREYSEEADID